MNQPRSLCLALQLLVSFCGLSSRLNAQQAFPQQSIDHMPSDLAVTPDGTVGIVRASEAWVGSPPTSQPDGITAWDMSNGQRLAITGQLTGFGLGENQGFLLTPAPIPPPLSLHFSDLVQTTNSRAIAIGSQHSPLGSGLDDTTFVDFVKIDQPTSETNPPTPPAVSHIAHWTLTDPTGTFDVKKIAGQAHDVAITPNGLIAVVSHRNWVHFFLMRSGSSLGSENIGSDPFSFNGSTFDFCSPDQAADSVEVTNTRAVVITTKGDPNSGQSIMVAYVFDLTTNPVTKLVGLHVGNNPALNNHPTIAHDLSITPDGSKAVVTGNFVAGLIDLASTPPSLKVHIDDLENRNYQRNADTVEVTNVCAVVTSSHTTTLGGALAHWRIEVFELSNFTIIGSGPYDEALPSPANEAHDLAITPNGKFAIVRAGVNILVVQNLDSTPTFPVVISGLGGDPMFGYATSSRSSDSIVATNLAAIGIGTNGNGNNSDGIVDFVDLTTTPPQLAQELLITHGGQNNPVCAADIKITPDGSRAIVRCTDPISAANAIRFYSLLSTPIGNLVTPNGSFGGAGNAFGVDSLEIGTSSLIMASELRLAFPNWNNGDGRVRVITLQ